MFKALALPIVIAALFWVTPASAQQFNYTYFDGGYSWFDLGDVNADGGGPEGRVSLGLTEHVHLFAAKSEGTVEQAAIKSDLESLVVGIGYATPLTHRIDAVGSVSSINLRADKVSGGHLTGNGYNVSVGTRGWVSDRVELSGDVDFTDVSGRANFGVGAATAISLKKSVAIVLDAQTTDGAWRYGAFLRLYSLEGVVFGKR